MDKIQNDLGWYFVENKYGFGIKRKDPSKKSLRNRIAQEILILIITAIIVFVSMILKGYPLKIIVWENYN